jgi:nucleotidyltransferase/DNA polymerase involved in DNA repair
LALFFLFSELEVLAAKTLEKLSEKFYTKIGVAMERWWKKLRGDKAENHTLDKLLEELPALFKPIYTKSGELLADFMEKYQLTDKISFPSTTFEEKIKKYVAEMIEEIKHTEISSGAQEVYKKVVDSDGKAVAIIVALLLLLSSNGLTGWETLGALLAGGAYKTLSNRDKEKLISSLADNTYQVLIKAINKLVFEDWQKVSDYLGNSLSHFPNEGKIKEFKGELADVREMMIGYDND